MGENSKIEWTDASWTPIRARHRATGKVGWHCTHASEGCRFCYAESMNKRLGTGLAFKPGHEADIEIFLDEEMLRRPLRWKKPRRIFVCSMTDLFADFVPDEWIARIFAVMALTPQHTFQVLTKRSARMRAYVSAPFPSDEQPHFRLQGAAWLRMSKLDRASSGAPPPPWPLPNVWLGVSAEDQVTANERVPNLLETPAAVRFVSAEPLLGPIDFTWISLGGGLILDALTGLHSDGEDAITGIIGQPDPHLDWIIAGGESGRAARPMHPEWPSALRNQCATAGVPFFFKQWGEWKNGSDFARDAKAVLNDGTIVEPTPEAMAEEDRRAPVPRRHPTMVRRVGKKTAGRLLDDREHNEFPKHPSGRTSVGPHNLKDNPNG